MNATAMAPRSSKADWFASWFDSAHYHRLYAHRDSYEARAFIDRLVARSHLKPGAKVLDLGCGTGRHAAHLASKGFNVIGLDLSAESLREARRNEGINLRFVRQDMRLPLRSRVFDHVLNLFTSFGYFDDPGNQLAVVQNIATTLKPSGTLVLDYLNAGYAETRLVREETMVRDGVIYHLSRWADPRQIHKRVVIDDGTAGAPLEFVERVAKLTLEDFRFMFALCDLKIAAVYGDYELKPFYEKASPRLILVATRDGGCGEAPATSARDACEFG